MNAIQFLQRIIPNDGIKIVAFLDGKFFKQFPCKNHEEVESFSKALSDKGKDSYFALASFKDESSRKAENVKSLKAFWLDLDCIKPNKTPKHTDYTSKQEAYNAVVKFCEDTKLPLPIVVQSGWGIHVYWVLDQEISYSVWKPIADEFKLLCVKSGFKIDPSRAADGASVLRPIETNNYKVADKVLPVKLIKDANDISLETFKAALKLQTKDDSVSSFSKVSAAILAAEEIQTAFEIPESYAPSSANRILGECQQLLWAYKNQAIVSEPLWFHGLSIFAHTKEGAKACHLFSNKDTERYTFEGTEQKIIHIQKSGEKGKPALCTTIEGARPGGCDGCKHKGKIKSPIVLGYENLGVEIEKVEVIGNVQVVQKRTLPPIPEPYFATDKGLFLKKDGVDKNGVPVIDYEFILNYPLYLVDVYDDVTESEIRGGEIVFTYKNPRGTWTDIRFAKVELDKADKIAEALNRSSLYVVNTDIPRIKAYMRAYLTKVYQEKANTPMVKHFGWSTDNSSFALGKKLFTKDGLKESVPSPGCYPVAEYITQKGSYEEWKRAFNTYFGKSGMELPALISGAAFGSVLLKFLNEPALVINLYGEASGMGKTSTALMIESTFGNAEKLKMRWDDTKVSSNTRSAVLSSLPIFIDEIHNAPPEEVSKFIYGSSSGRGKNRAQQDGRERVNDTVWNNIWITTSNISLVGSLLNSKGNSNAEQVRLIEVEFSSTPWQLHEAKPLMETIQNNYGYALEVFAKHCVENLQQVEAGVRELHAKMLQHFSAKPHERFWFAGMAAILYGCKIANELGITTYDLNALKTQVKNILSKSRNIVVDSKRGVSDILASFYADNYGSALQVEADRLGKGWIINKRPLHKFFIRFESDTNKMVVVRSHFNKWCRENGVETKEFYEKAKGEGILISYDDGSSLCKGTDARDDIRGRNLVFMLKKGE